MTGQQQLRKARLGAARVRWEREDRLHGGSPYRQRPARRKPVNAKPLDHLLVVGALALLALCAWAGIVG